MTGELNPRSRRDSFGSKINRTHSPFIAMIMPWMTIVLGSVLPVIPLVAAIPFVPPLGYMFLLAWRFVRPGLLPPWAGMPLGAIDDLYSGQPFGTAILFWSLTLLAIDVIEARIPWRSYLHDWLAAALLMLGYLLVRVLFGGSGDLLGVTPLIAPQFLLALLLYPLIGRMVALFDRLRLLRVRKLD